MAYFHCLIGGGSSGGGLTLTVTCDSQFAGTTITCTDGVTTLTKTCPSASPYEVVFEIPNGGDWTISGVVGGHTVSTGVNIPTSAELIATVQQTVTIHSATEDTVTFTDASGVQKIEVFASGQSSKSIDITIQPNGQSITFTSSVAKNPDDLSQYYSKTVTVDESTQTIALMPENTLYWYGYKNNIESCASSYNVVYNTNDIHIEGDGSALKLSGVCSSNAITPTKIHGIAFRQNYNTMSGGFDMQMGLPSTKSVSDSSRSQIIFDRGATSHKSADITNQTGYLAIRITSYNWGNIYALWYE